MRQPVRQLDPEDRLRARVTRRRWRVSSRRATSACRPTVATTASPTGRSRSRSSTPSDLPVNTAAPTVDRLRLPGRAADLQPRHVERRRRAATTFTAGIARTRSSPNSPRLRAPTQADYGNFTTTRSTRRYGNQALTVAWTRRSSAPSDTYTPTAADVGKAIYCTVNVNNAGATVWKYAARAGDPVGDATRRRRGRHRPGDARADAGHAGHVRRVHAGRREGLRRQHDGHGHLDRRFGHAVDRRSVDHRHGQARQRRRSRCRRRCRRAPRAPAGTGSAALADVGGSAAPTQLLSYAGPVSNDAVTVAFRQHISAGDALRTGAYSKTLTLTLATTRAVGRVAHCRGT